MQQKDKKIKRRKTGKREFRYRNGNKAPLTTLKMSENKQERY